MSTPRRIAFYGNTCNNFFAIARAVRAASDIDAHLFIDDNADWMQFPESEDPSLRDNYPHWIHKGPYHTMTTRFWPGKSPLVKELERFDVVMVSGGGVRLAPFVDKRFIFYVTGWDLTMSPFPLKFIRLPPNELHRKAAALLGGFWQRRGIKAIDEIWTQPFMPFRTAAERLGIEKSRLLPNYFPIMIDTDVYKEDPSARTSDNPHVRRMLDGHDFVIFHPSRMMLNKAPQFVDAGNWKGNDTLIRGYAKFVAANPDAKPALVLIDHAYSPDLAEAKALVSRLGIEKHVVWLKGPKDRGFDRIDLIPFYSVADVVADEFGIGWFGSVVVEGLSMGKPTLCTLDEEVMKQLYPWHPILSPRNDDEVATMLGRLYREKDERLAIGAKGRAWAVEFHSIANAAARYVRQIQSACE